MWIDKFKPLYGPEVEAGAEEIEQAPPPETPIEETPEGPGSGRSAIRKSLEKGFEAERKAEADRNKKGQYVKQGKRVAGGAELEAPAEEETPEETPVETTPAPESLAKEAKAEWGNTPKAIQDAFLKREADMEKGVKELQAKYSDLDQALAPHMNAIRQHGHTPAQAVSQLFAWMQALAANPDVAFPALAKSFGHDITKFAGQMQQQQQQQQETTPEGGALDPAAQKFFEERLKAFEEQFGKKLSGLETTFQRETQEKTNQVLANWSKDKTHFEAVRELMAHLIQSGAVPLKEGQVDLDGAYERAIWAHPEVRAKLLAEQEAAKVAEAKKKAEDLKKKQQAEADKARKAGVSVGSGAPGEAPASGSGKKGKSKSIRESIAEAVEQLRD